MKWGEGCTTCRLDNEIPIHVGVKNKQQSFYPHKVLYTTQLTFIGPCNRKCWHKSARMQRVFARPCKVCGDIHVTSGIATCGRYAVEISYRCRRLHRCSCSSRPRTSFASTKNTRKACSLSLTLKIYLCSQQSSK